jgi:hypothetical protein
MSSGVASSGSPQTSNGNGTRCVATVSINTGAAKRNRQEDLNAEHKTCGNSALGKSIEKNISKHFIVDCFVVLSVCGCGADSRGRGLQAVVFTATG